MDVYKILYNPQNVTEESFEGVYGISIVDDPANGINFIALSKNKEVKLATANEEKRLLVGPVLIPEQRIYRDWFDGCEIYFDTQTIRLASQEFLKNGYQKNSTIDHTSDPLNGVSFVESWIVEDSEKDKSSVYGFDVPAGTWMVAMKIEDDSIWNDFVKGGKVKGFSIDSFFDIEKVKTSLSKTNNKKTKEYNMKKGLLSRIQALFAEEGVVEKLMIEVEGLGKLWAEDFSMDYVVYAEVDGAEVPFADGEFVYEGKEFKTDAEGKIVSIEDVVADEVDDKVDALTDVILKSMRTEFNKMRKELKLDAVDELETVVVDRADELSDVVAETKDLEDVQALKDKIAELEAIIDTMKSEVEDKVKEVEDLVAENVQLKKSPAATKLTAQKGEFVPKAGMTQKEINRAKLFAKIK